MKMKSAQKLIYALGFAIFIFFLSMFAAVIPCQTAPNIPSPKYQWTFCSLNPDLNNQQGIQRKYLGYTSSLTTTYIMVVILSFIAALTLLHFTARKRKD